MTAEIVNLKSVRKRLARADKERRAEENRRLFGASKDERAMAANEKRRTERAVDGAERRTTAADLPDDAVDPGAVS